MDHAGAGHCAGMAFMSGIGVEEEYIAGDDVVPARLFMIPDGGMHDAFAYHPEQKTVESRSVEMELRRIGESAYTQRMKQISTGVVAGMGDEEFGIRGDHARFYGMDDIDGMRR